MDEATVAPRWNPLTRFLFRFACCYFLLLMLPFPLSIVTTLSGGVRVAAESMAPRWPEAATVASACQTFEEQFAAVINAPWTELNEKAVRWVGAEFGWNVTASPYGSGDTTFNYVQLLCFASVALVFALLVTILDSGTRAYPRSHRWLLVALRFYVATMLVGYGADKAIPAQMPMPPVTRLFQPFGDASPMGLLWAFMGASPAFQIFTGIGEMVAGVLLMMRRTTVLGVFVGAAVLTNVVALNFCYDVPVKLFSSHLLLMTLVIGLPHARRACDFFLRNRPAAPAPLVPLFGSPPLDFLGHVVRVALIAATAGTTLHQSWEYTSTLAEIDREPLVGLFEVDGFVADGVDVPPLLTDRERWQRLVLVHSKFGATDVRRAMVYACSGDARAFGVELPADPSELVLTPTGAAGTAAVFALTPLPGCAGESYGAPLLLDGHLDGRPVQLVVHRVDRSHFLLVNRGFHWINEFPFHR